MRRPWWFVSKQTKHCEIATHVLESFPKHAPPQRLLPASHNPCFNAIFVDGTNYPCVLWCTFPFSNEEIAEERACVTSSKRVCLVTADTYTSIFGLRVSPEVVNTVSQSGFAFKALWVFYVVSLWSWMFRVLLKSKFCSRSLWHGLGDAWPRSLLVIPSLWSRCGASWANGWCRNCGWEQASSLLPPHRGTWKGSIICWEIFLSLFLSWLVRKTGTSLSAKRLSRALLSFWVRAVYVSLGICTMRFGSVWSRGSSSVMRA